MRNCNPQEENYYSEPRCGTCMWHYRNVKLDENRPNKVGPWVCANEKCKFFNRCTTDDDHHGCRHWEKRRVDIWLSRYKNMRRCKKLNSKSYQYTYRNLDFMYKDVYEFFIEHLNDIYHGVLRSIEDHTVFVARHFGVLKEDVTYCVLKRKEELEDVE